MQTQKTKTLYALIKDQWGLELVPTRKQREPLSYDIKIVNVPITEEPKWAIKVLSHIQWWDDSDKGCSVDWSTRFITGDKANANYPRGDENE